MLGSTRTPWASLLAALASEAQPRLKEFEAVSSRLAGLDVTDRKEIFEFLLLCEGEGVFKLCRTIICWAALSTSTEYRHESREGSSTLKPSTCRSAPAGTRRSAASKDLQPPERAADDDLQGVQGDRSGRQW